MGDVSGKGVGAALLMASLQATIRARLGARARPRARSSTRSTARWSSEEPLAPYYTLFLARARGSHRPAALRQRRPQHAVRAAARRRAERLPSTGRPPGLYPGGGYEERDGRAAGRRRALPLHRRPRRGRGRGRRAVRHGASRGAAQGPPRRRTSTRAARRTWTRRCARTAGRSRPPTTRRWSPCASRAARSREPAGEARPRRPRRARVGRRSWSAAAIYGAAVAWDAAQRGLVGGARRARGLRRRRVLEQPEDDPRRHALPAEARPRPRCASPRASGATLLRHRARARAAAAVPRARPTATARPGARRSRSASLLNDWLTRDRNRGLPPERTASPPARTVSAAEALRLVPGLEPRGLTGAALWHDAQAASTERLTLGFVHAAAGRRRRRARTTRRPSRCCAPAGRVAGVAVRDTLGGAHARGPRARWW